MFSEIKSNAGPQTPEDWDALCTEWEASGLTQSQFCKKKGISYTTFCYYRTRQKQEERSSERKLLPIRVPSASGENPSIQLRLKNGLEVNLESISPDQVTWIIQTLVASK